jgi:N-acetylglutamate synthase/N-acetylornithine aminotransferase
VRLPVERILAAVSKLHRALSSSPSAARKFSRAIMTTDTRPKLAGAALRCAGGRGALLGIAKGAGMIHPRLALKQATMLVYLFTDVAATPAQLRRLLRGASARTFNRISVDGDTSTNDTVLLVASGASGLRVRARADEKNLAAALEAVCASLAKQIVSDGEGVRHVVELRVEGARTEAEAERVARSIANSPLVKTAWAGADPNWGRILAAVGISGVPIDPRRVDVYFGPIQVCRGGAAWPFRSVPPTAIFRSGSSMCECGWRAAAPRPASGPATSPKATSRPTPNTAPECRRTPALFRTGGKGRPGWGPGRNALNSWGSVCERRWMVGQGWYRFNSQVVPSREYFCAIRGAST